MAMTDKKPALTAVESIFYAIKTVLMTSGSLLFVVLLIFVLCFYWQHSGK
jgi:hypothetical protein